MIRVNYLKLDPMAKILDDLITNTLPNISNETEKSRRKKKERSCTNFFVSCISIFNDQQDFTEEF